MNFKIPDILVAKFCHEVTPLGLRNAKYAKPACPVGRLLLGNLEAGASDSVHSQTELGNEKNEKNKV